MSLLILIVVSYISFLASADELGKHKNCQWNHGWGSWSDCENGYQFRTKTCKCKNPPPPIYDLPPYPTDEPDYPIDEPDYPIDEPDYPIDEPDYPVDEPDYPIDEPDYPEHDSRRSVSDCLSDCQAGCYSECVGSRKAGCIRPCIDECRSTCSGTAPGPARRRNWGHHDDDECEFGEEKTETRACCVWSEWSDFSECSKSCDGGEKTRTRECICGNDDEPYPEPYPVEYEDSRRSVSDCLSECQGVCYSECVGSRKAGCIRPCIAECREQCGTDRRRTWGHHDEPKKCKGHSIETLPCNEFPCCDWGEFCEWSECGAPCGGVRRRYAKCECNPPVVVVDPPFDHSYEGHSELDNEYEPDYFECVGDQPYEEENCEPCPYY